MMMVELFTSPLTVTLLALDIFLFCILIDHSQLEILIYYTAGQNKKALSCDRTFFDYGCELHTAEAGVDFAEHVADDGSEDHQSGDDDDGNQNEN
jgi:hypothetical protein